MPHDSITIQPLGSGRAGHRGRPTAPHQLWGRDLDIVARRLGEAEASGLPLYAQLRNVISILVVEGTLKAGTQLPPEQRLAAATGFSLGTVQKALAQLAEEGWVRREHGRGTFVAEPRRSVKELWHYRFVDPESGDQLPVYSSLVGRSLVAGTPLLGRALGPDPAGFVEIERLVDVGGHFLCHSRMHLPAGRYGALLTLPASAFEGVNLKQLLAESFGAPTVTITQHLTVERPSARAAALLRLPRGALGILLEVTARTHGRAPLSFQSIFIPRTRYRLDVSPFGQGEPAL